MKVYPGTSAGIAETRAYLESLQAMATATPAPTPVVVMTATPASTPANPSWVSSFASWWDNSHVWKDISGWFKSHWPFGKPPAPPSPPSGDGGTGDDPNEWKMTLLRVITRLFLICLGIVGMIVVYSLMVSTRETYNSAAAIERAKVDQEFVKPFATVDKLKVCARLAELPAYQVQGLPAECSGTGGGVSSPLPAQLTARPVAHNSTCPTKAVGSQLVRLSSPECVLQGVGGRDSPAFHGTFTVTEISGGGQVVSIDISCGDFGFNQSLPQKAVSVGKTLTGCFTLAADHGTTFTVTAK